MRFFLGLILSVSLSRCLLAAEDASAVQPDPLNAPKPAAEKPVPDERTLRQQEEIHELRQFTGHTAAVTCGVFSPDDKRAVSCSEDKTVRLWDVETGQEIRRFGEGTIDKVLCVGLSADGAKVFAGGADKIVRVWDAATGEETGQYTGHSEAIAKLVLSADGKWLVTTGVDGEIRRWDLTTGEGILLIKADPTTAATARPVFAQARVWAWTDPDSLAKWDLPSWKRLGQGFESKQLPAGEVRLAFSANEELLISVVGNEIYVFNHGDRIDQMMQRQTGLGLPVWRKAGAPLKSSLDKIEQIQFSFEDKYLKVYGGGGAMECWRIADDLKEWKSAGQFPADIKGVRFASLSADGSKGITGYEDGKLSLWSLAPPRYTPEEGRSLDLGVIWNLFNSARYDELEGEFAKLRKEKSRFFTGDMCLSSCYETLHQPFEGKSPADWKAHFEKLEQWKRAKPDSATPLLANAGCLTNYAWEARGGGPALTVGEEGWRLFHERLGESKQIVEAAETLVENDPEVYRLKIHLGIGGQYSREEVDRALEQGIAIDRHFWSLYDTMSIYLLPRWHGGPGELEEWAAKFADAAGARGDELYARVVMHMADYIGEAITESEFSYDRIKVGLNILDKKLSDSQWVANYRAFLACIFHDLETAQDALPKINDRVDFWEKLWGSPQRLARFRRWADPNLPRGQEKLLIWAYRNQALQVRPADETLLFSVGTDRYDQLKLWNLKTGKLLSRMPLSDALVPTAAFSADNHWLAFAERDDQGLSQVRLWDLKTPRPQDPLPGKPGDNVQAVVWSPDGNLVASADHGSAAMIWNLADRDKSIRLEHPGQVLQVVFSPDGKQLATVALPRTAYIWDVETGKQLDSVMAVPSGGRTLQFSPDGRLLTLLGHNGNLVLWDIASKEQSTITVKASPTALAFSHDGKWFATGDLDHEIRIWDASSRTTVKTFGGHFGTIWALVYTADDQQLISGSADGTVRFWDVSAQAK